MTKAPNLHGNGSTVAPRSGYAKFRTRWRHVLWIDQRIRSGQAPNCRRLAEGLEVSRRTVLRDIDFLRYDLGAPVTYDAKRRGYVYAEPDWVMPTVRITEGELFAILVAERALEAYSGTPWAHRLQSVFDRMLASLPDRVEVAPQELLPRVRFDGLGESIIDPGIMEAVAAAVAGNQTVRLRYPPLGQTQPREYVVDPYLLYRARGAWYLVGRDHRSGHVPMFNLSRIRTVEPTGATFDYEAAGFDPKRYFAATFGTYEAPTRHRVVVEFSGVAAQLVRERRWHASQELQDRPGGRLRFEVEVSHLDDIWPWVLSWGSLAKVIRPRELREIVLKQAAGVVGRYARRAENMTEGDASDGEAP